MAVLRVLFPDQLSEEISSLENTHPDDVILLAETVEECTYVKHHKKKLILLLSAMRHFAQQYKEKGYNVYYIPLEKECKNYTHAVEEVLEKFSFSSLVCTMPSEYRQKCYVEGWQRKWKIPVHIEEDTRFFCNFSWIESFGKNKKRFLMEHFYRSLRKKTGLLMEKEKPCGAKWNFDVFNREPIKNEEELPDKGPAGFVPDKITNEVIKLVEARFSDHFGDARPFWFAVTKIQAEQAFEEFCTYHLPFFGKYQDAMQEGYPYLYHSLISPYLNCGLLLPKKVCIRVEQLYKKGKIPLECAEAFIRQILGWREYVRVLYWLSMPGYEKQNFFEAKKSLPDWYWTGGTDMNCLKQVIGMTKKEAYSHHIQRLMITGNFALLAGILPEQVHEWYLIVYADAYEWVELPNTLGMALYADGGKLASKPYVAGGNYISKMSNFCKKCPYNPKKRTGLLACPFTKLYWNFLITHEKKLEKNMRLRFAYKALASFSLDEKRTIQKEAKQFLEKEVD